MNRLDWIVIGLVGYGVWRMTVNRTHIEYTKRLIARLQAAYLLQQPTLPGGKPLTFSQAERLLRYIAKEGYGIQ